MIVIDNVTEENNKIIVNCSHDYGTDKISFPLKDIKRDTITNIPIWQSKLKKFIEEKYKNSKTPSSFLSQFKGTTI